MKSFSLKKNDGDSKKKVGAFSLKKKDGNPVKKTGGFSLKTKSASSGTSDPFDSGLDNTDGGQLGKKVEISSVDELVLKAEKEPDLVIKPLLNENSWEYKRQKALAKLQQNDQTASSEEEKGSLSYGLNVLQKQVQPVQPELPASPESPKNGKSITSQARQSLINEEDLSENTAEVIETSQSLEPPPAPTLDSYKKIPVEKFGAAMLRGMGWKGVTDKEKKMRKQASSGPRIPFLGLGAKPAPNQEDPSYRPSKSAYTPVVLVDKTTGKVVEEVQEPNKPNSGLNSRDISPVRSKTVYRER